DRLITLRQLTGRADLRIPGMHAGDRHEDLTVARRVPSVRSGPQHRDVAHREVDRAAAHAETIREARWQRIVCRELAESQEAGVEGADGVGIDRPIFVEERI